jgi:hypothetical protein
MLKKIIDKVRSRAFFLNEKDDSDSFLEAGAVFLGDFNGPIFDFCLKCHRLQGAFLWTSRPTGDLSLRGRSASQTVAVKHATPTEAVEKLALGTVLLFETVAPSGNV